ncbi:hypothetical protein ABBQ32_002335 [Trebouxia sp. C0010 RCD-2024]
MDNSYEIDDCTPSTPEAELYAAGGRTGPMRRAPKHRTAFTPEGIQAVRDARANRGNSAASGSGAGPTPAPAPRTGAHAPRTDPHAPRTGPPAPRPPQPSQRPQAPPPPPPDLIKHLQACNRAATPADTRTPAAKRAAELPSEPPRNPRPFAPPRPQAVEHGPVPMETTLETEAFYHDQGATTNAVVRAEVNVLGRVFEGIIDTGASDTVLSHSVVRRLGLMDELVPSRITFLTAAGKTERPMGMLTDQPITIGSLCLHLDCMVRKANNYNVLVGNDWLRMAGSDLLLSQGVLRNRLAPDHYEEVQIDTRGDFPKMHMVQPKDPRGVRTAIQCLEQSQPILHTAASDASDLPELPTDSDSTSQPDSDLLTDHITTSVCCFDDDSDNDDFFARAHAAQDSDSIATDSASVSTSGAEADSEDNVLSTPATNTSSTYSADAIISVEPQAVGMPAFTVTLATADPTATLESETEVDPEPYPETASDPEPEDEQQYGQHGLSMESMEPDSEEFLSDPAPTDDMLPREVISSHGHQMLTLHEPTSSDSSQIDSEPDLEDITHDLPDVSPLWQDDSMVWSDDYSPDLT